MREGIVADAAGRGVREVCGDGLFGGGGEAVGEICEGERRAETCGIEGREGGRSGVYGRWECGRGDRELGGAVLSGHGIPDEGAEGSVESDGERGTRIYRGCEESEVGEGVSDIGGDGEVGRGDRFGRDE